MLRFNSSVTRWLLAAFALSVLLAWPLHEARHAAAEHPLAGAMSADGTDGSEDGPAGGCLWCVFHADHLAPSGAPPALRLRAEVSAPPAVLSGGLPAGPCALAAAPRGPPLA